ncbi:MAG: hypothetical protein WBM02_12455 [bacterium]
MIDILAAVLMGLAVFGAALYIYICVFITVLVVADLFNKWKLKNSVNKDDIGFLINEGINNGKYQTVSGVFNKSTGQVKDAWRIQGEKGIDKEFTDEVLTLFS